MARCGLDAGNASFCWTEKGIFISWVWTWQRHACGPWGSSLVIMDDTNDMDDYIMLDDFQEVIVGIVDLNVLSSRYEVSIGNPILTIAHNRIENLNFV